MSNDDDEEIVRASAIQFVKGVTHLRIIDYVM